MSSGERESFYVADWLIEPTIDTISRGTTTVKLEPRTMRLLLCLVDAAGTVVSQERLLSEVWSGVIVGPASVYQSVSQLRRLLGDTDPNPTYVATIPRKGYRLVAPVRPRESPPAAMTSVSAEQAAQPPAGSDAAAVTPPADARRSRRVPLLAGVTLLLLAAALLWWSPLRQLLQPAATLPSIAVLPFVDMSVEKTDQPFCDGLAEELSNWLAQVPTLHVVARTSAFAYRGQSLDVRKIGKELGTTHLLEGSMRRSGSDVKVTVQLVDTKDGYHLWSGTFSRPFEDTLKIQEEVARAVAQNLEIRLTQDFDRRLSARSGTNSQAYRLYLLARYHRQAANHESNEQAIELYRQVLALDPRFALAYIGLVYCYLDQVYFDRRAVQDVATDAEPLLAAAQRLEPALPELYAARGALRLEQSRVDEASRELRRAVELNPSSSAAYAELGRIAILSARPREALGYFSTVATLNPLDAVAHAWRCVALQDMARYDEAKFACERARVLQPAGPWGAIVSGWLALSQGQIEAALQWNAVALRAAPDDLTLYESAARNYIILGLPARARAILLRAHTVMGDSEDLTVALLSVAFVEGGTAALRNELSASGVEASNRSKTLLSAAYFRLLLGDVQAARQLTDRAFRLPDFAPSSLVDPWQARWGEGSYPGLVVAVSELRTGDAKSAEQRLNAITAVADQAEQAGTQRYGVDELRALILTLRGDANGAMRALTRAADRGWRRAWWAEREPYFAALQQRADFRALMSRVHALNALSRQRIAQGLNPNPP